jgi:hypothetical protein
LIRQTKSLQATRRVLAVLAIILALAWIRLGLHVYRCHVVDSHSIGPGLRMEPVGPNWIRGHWGKLDSFAWDRPLAVTVEIGSSVSRAETAEVFACLEGLTSLEGIGLLGTGVTDAEILRLRGMHRLRHLNLLAPRVSATGLAVLADMPALDYLHIDSPLIDDTALVRVSRVSHLSALRLSGTAVTDAGMKHLAALKNLNELTINQAAITDAGLLELRGLTNLRHLSVSQTGVTEAGIAELRESLPDLEVSDD